MVVAHGTGTLTCGSQAFALHPNDVAAIPAWTWQQLTARDHELVVFRLTDRPIHDACGLYGPRQQVPAPARQTPSARDCGVLQHS